MGALRSRAANEALQESAEKKASHREPRQRLRTRTKLLRTAMRLIPNEAASEHWPGVEADVVNGFTIEDQTLILKWTADRKTPLSLIWPRMWNYSREGCGESGAARTSDEFNPHFRRRSLHSRRGHLWQS